MKTFEEIEKMILTNIEQIDKDLNYGLNDKIIKAGLYQAKSVSLQALVNLKFGYENSEEKK